MVAFGQVSQVMIMIGQVMIAIGQGKLSYDYDRTSMIRYDNVR